jgi:CheY-like chemotaxis protein
MGYEVILPCGNPAVERADVIVVYLDFPQMRTIRTIRELRDDQKTAHTPIIVFLPWTYKHGTAAALHAGANEVFDGPLTIEALQAGIEKYAPQTADPCRPTAENQLPTPEAIKLRVA